MHKKIEEIKKSESKPKVLKNIFTKEEIDQFLNLYSELPITVHNKKQNVIKKRWLIEYGKRLEKLFYDKLKMRLEISSMTILKLTMERIYWVYFKKAITLLVYT